ncbi:F0F1 ATP synthase subunit delta [Chondromyces apiculatus]|uniref:ATP synthase subunit delta n=1 Tax=Chondromyces apiculatus DSM 436 TaxID=1192034 RepID=A0A017T8P4_9BACT|nr:F0F1 ATP synthase subunit delta [Chondromyces apiculatus]EYF05589.1 ATP synthase delta chain [Chondromyces apiculatus DSM 436]
MSYDSIARRYARAIFEIGKETGTLPRLTQDLGEFSATYAENEELRFVLDNPLLPEAQREALLADLGTRMSLSDTTLRALRLLGQRRRLPALPAIARQLSRLADEDQGVVRAVVTSAGPLNEAYLARLRAEIEKATGKKVAITHKQDPSLIAGVVTKIGDQVIDGSVRARLSSFRESLLRT